MANGSLSVLRNRNFSLLWSASLVSSIGTWMQTVAVAALVTELTDKAFWGGLVGAVAYLSSAFVTPFGGVLADRRDRRQLMIWSTVAEAFLALGLAALYIAGEASPLVITIITALEGACLAVALPARQALLPDIVDRDQIPAAASLSFASYNLGRVVGPALGGLFIAIGSYAWVFTFNAVTFLVVVVATVLVRVPKHVVVPVTTSVIARLKEGWEGARNEPGCWAAIRMIAVMAVLISPFIALIPAMSQLVLNGDPVDTAHLVTGQGVGAVAGAFLFPVLIARFSRERVVRINLFALPVITAVYAYAPNMIVAIAAVTLLGMSYIAVLSGLSATMQTRAPADVRARAIAMFSTVMGLAYPLGAITQGWLGDQIGVRETLAAGAVLFLAYSAARKPASIRELAVD